MSEIPVSFHPDAVAEADAAVAWYAIRSPRAAERFLAELECCVQAIVDSPERWPVFKYGARKITFRRFPYLVIYRVVPEQIQILAVAHGKRRPGYWRDRTAN
jgi:plasmid stabilization system protein ParE